MIFLLHGASVGIYITVLCAKHRQHFLLCHLSRRLRPHITTQHQPDVPQPLLHDVVEPVVRFKATQERSPTTSHTCSILPGESPFRVRMCQKLRVIQLPIGLIHTAALSPTKVLTRRLSVETHRPYRCSRSLRGAATFTARFRVRWLGVVPRTCPPP